MSRMTGKQIEASRGYAIHQWSGDDIDAGKVLPFTTAPAHSFDWQRHATVEDARACIASAPVLRQVHVSFEAYVPVDATEKQIKEWVRFELHANSSIGGDNPLSKHGLEAIEVSIDDVVDIDR